MLPTEKISESDLPEYDMLMMQCYSNMAACQLKANSYVFVVANSTKALDIEPNNVKCMYRRAEAYFHLGSYDLCRNDILKGLQLEPKSRSFHDLYKQLPIHKINQICVMQLSI